MQMHNERSEYWVVVSGVAKITNNEIEFTLQENQSTYIPKTQKHRLEKQKWKTIGDNLSDNVVIMWVKAISLDLTKDEAVFDCHCRHTKHQLTV